MHTTESKEKSVMGCACYFKGTSGKKKFIVEKMAVQYAERFVMHTVESEFVNLMIKCLNEIVTVFENTLSC